MTCTESRELLAALLDDEASAEEAAESARHLRSCDDCRKYKEELILVQERLREWPDELGAGRRLCGAAPAAPRATTTAWRLAAAAILLLAAAGGYAAGRISGAGPMASATPGVPAFFEERRIVYPNRHEVHSEVILRAADPAALRIQ